MERGLVLGVTDITAVRGVLKYEGFIDTPKILVDQYLSQDVRKLVFGISDKVRNKPDCTVTEEGQKLEISALRRREIVLFM